MTKRIALVGNMNNNFFAITRYLRDMGYDAHLFYRVGMDHFQPKADTYSLSYTDYCHEIKWLKNGFHNVDENEVRNTLKGYNFYIGQSDEAAVAKSCGFNMNVYYPYGTDVTKYALLPPEYSLRDKILSFFRSYEKKRITYSQMKKGTLAKYQRSVIVEAENILAEYTNNEFIAVLKSLDYKGKFDKVPMPFIYLPEYERLNSGMNADTHWKTEIDKIRKDNDFILLYHGRQEWKSYHHDFNGKNTHHLIQGFADFIKKHPSKKAALVMLEYGNDVTESKELVVELGISNAVHWLPSMYRKDIMYLVKNVDICSGEFALSYLTFGTVVEAMLMKKPIVHYRDDKLYAGIYNELYPMLCAKSPSEISVALEFAHANPSLMKEMGEESYQWLKKYFIEQPLTYLQSLIEKS